MKTQFSSLLLSLVLASCGSDSHPAQPSAPVAPTVEAPAPIAVAPTPEKPVVVETLKAIEKLEAPKAPTKYSEAMEDGKAFEAKGDHARARDLFTAAIKLDKKQSDPHVELARSYIATNEKHLAVVEANKAVKLAPSSSRAWNTLGRAQLARWSYQGAVDAFKKATELDPDNAWAWNNLGYTELAFKSYKPAVDALVIATAKSNATGFMWNNLGTAYEHLDQLDDAREAFEKGGKLGSAQAVASRKRLEGVETMITVASAKVVDKKVEKVDTSYDTTEGPAVQDPDETVPEVEQPAAVDPASAETTDAGVTPTTL